MSTLYVYLIVYTLLLIGVSWYVSRKQSAEDFLISGRDRSMWQILVSKFAVAIGAGFFITYTGFAYEYGIGVFAMIVGLVIGYFVYGYWAAPKIRALSSKHKMYTQGDFITTMLKSETSRKVTNYVGIVIVIFWLLASIVGGAKIIAEFGFVSYPLAVLMMCGIVYIYMMIGGYKSVIVTDIIQGFVILILMAVVAISIFMQNPVPAASFFSGKLDVMNAIAFFVFGILSLYSSVNIFQLSYASKSPKAVQKGMILAVIPIAVVMFFLFVIGVIVAIKSPGIAPGLAFTEALRLFLPVSLIPAAVTLFFAGIMSSSDTNVFSIASHLFKEQSVKKLQVVITIVTILSGIVALIFPDVVGLSILAGGSNLVLSAGVIYVLCGGKSNKKYLASVAGGIIGMIVGIAIFGIEPNAAIPIILGTLLGLLWKR